MHPYWLQQALVLSYVSLVWVRREPAAIIAVFDHHRVGGQFAQPNTLSEVYLLVDLLLACHLIRSLIFRPAVGFIRAAGDTVADAASMHAGMTNYTGSVSVLTYLCSAYWLGASSDAF